MPIVHQSVPASYSHFPAQPQLLLAAPRIAGLLPARVPSSEVPPEPDAPLRFIFDRPSLADLTDQQREHLYESTSKLLEIAIEFMVGTFNEEALRAAEVIFHRGVGGKSALRPLGPKAFNAEVDADTYAEMANSRAAQKTPQSDLRNAIRDATYHAAAAELRNAWTQRKEGGV